MSDIELSVVIPAYNEEHGISNVLDELQKVMSDIGISYEIVVVDDGSEDNTTEMVRGKKGIILVQHPANKGYGAALKTGIRHSNGEFILITDADGTYPTKEVPKLLEYKDDYDMVVGARINKKAKIPLSRRPAKFFLSKLANYLAETKIPDLNSGMRIFRKETAEQFLNILPSGFSFTATITLAYLSNDYLIKYVPIDYYERKGKSKISPVRDTLGFTSLIIRTITYFNPLKVFLPIGLALFFAAIFVFAYSTFVLGRFMDVATIVLVVASIQIALFGLLADLVVRRSEHE
ncbi:putative glycosyltransferase [subsurface metagenome]|jgi:glycosyltransferase involved in cell wall biosynthesis